ncbi:MAG: hypothetical protein KDD75_15890, partial [Caldilineaceae bacterium]|nr:hypothetical protein [Caldilineaceae bacterium]
WIQPAAGDAGGALGAALAAWHLHHGQPRSTPAGDAMRGGYLGPSYAQADIEARLRAVGAMFELMDDDAALTRQAAADLAEENVVGWFQGAMEFGPRALGGRSILADPRRVEMQRTLNLKVKFRESFRPFAPAVQREAVADWFDLDSDSPYMLLVADVAQPHRTEMTEAQQALFGIEKLNIKRSSIPAVTHVDYSARVQTVHANTNPAYHALITAFKQLTNCPVLVNTSFNVRGEPIVCTPLDAFKCFMGTDIDVLVLENVLLLKEEQDKAAAKYYAATYELD